MGRYTKGWVKIYREMIDGDIGANGHCLALMVLLIAWANREDGTASVKFNGQPIKLKRGQVIIGIRSIAERLGFAKSTIYRQLEYLTRRKSIGTLAGTEGTLVTINNYELYQDGEEEAGHLAERERDRCATPSGEVRKKKEENTCLQTTHALMEIWNRHCGQMRTCRGMNKDRLRKAERIWKLNPSTEYWSEIVIRMAKSSFLRGEKKSDNHPNWRADFDFLLQESTHLKVLEGKYDDAQGGPKFKRIDLFGEGVAS